MGAIADDDGVGGARQQNKRSGQKESTYRDGLGDDKPEDLAATPRIILI
jgi:hypothetical protein